MEDTDTILCGFCHTGESKNEICGQLHVEKIENGSKTIAAHHKCMQYSAQLTQYKFDHFGGFKIDKVQEELNRGKYLKCILCKNKVKNKKRSCNQATAGCAVKSCRKSFHYLCAKLDESTVVKRLLVRYKNPVKEVVLYRVFCSREHEEEFKENKAELKSEKDSEDDDSDPAEGSEMMDMDQDSDVGSVYDTHSQDVLTLSQNTDEPKKNKGKDKKKIRSNPSVRPTVKNLETGDASSPLIWQPKILSVTSLSSPPVKLQAHDIPPEGANFHITDDSYDDSCEDSSTDEDNDTKIEVESRNGTLQSPKINSSVAGCTKEKTRTNIRSTSKNESKNKNRPSEQHSKENQATIDKRIKYMERVLSMKRSSSNKENIESAPVAKSRRTSRTSTTSSTEYTADCALIITELPCSDEVRQEMIEQIQSVAEKVVFLSDIQQDLEDNLMPFVMADVAKLLRSKRYDELITFLLNGNSLNLRKRQYAYINELELNEEAVRCMKCSIFHSIKDSLEGINNEFGHTLCSLFRIAHITAFVLFVSEDLDPTGRLSGMLGISNRPVKLHRLKEGKVTKTGGSTRDLNREARYYAAWVKKTLGDDAKVIITPTEEVFLPCNTGHEKSKTVPNLVEEMLASDLQSQHPNSNKVVVCVQAVEKSLVDYNRLCRRTVENYINKGTSQDNLVFILNIEKGHFDLTNVLPNSMKMRYCEECHVYTSNNAADGSVTSVLLHIVLC